jgi:hypothetical protein
MAQYNPAEFPSYDSKDEEILLLKSPHHEQKKRMRTMMKSPSMEPRRIPSPWIPFPWPSQPPLYLPR